MGGPATSTAVAGKGLALQFPGNAGSVNCYLDTLSKTAPGPLPGGHSARDTLFFTGKSKDFDSGDKLTYGQPGMVVGPATSTVAGKGLALQFPGNAGSVNCYLNALSKT